MVGTACAKTMLGMWKVIVGRMQSVRQSGRDAVAQTEVEYMIILIVGREKSGRK